VASDEGSRSLVVANTYLRTLFAGARRDQSLSRRRSRAGRRLRRLAPPPALV
jgi:hypothetical protein